MSSYSEDMINQITLNCLISKTQLMKINNSKIKKNIDDERNKKINKYHDKLIKLFQDLLNKRELSNLFDDVKTSYIHFIDKAIIYLDNFDDQDDANNDTNEEKNNNNQEENNNNNQVNDTLNIKLTDMMNECYDKRYNEMMLEEEQEEQEEPIFEDYDENDEDDEY